MMKLNASSYKGKQIVERASHVEGYELRDVYNTWSIAKEHAFEWCYNQYIKTENHARFLICSHNSQAFTCAWFGEKDGERILRYETKDNSYIVYLDK